MKRLIYLLACAIVVAFVFLNVLCTPFVPDPAEVLLTVQVTGTGRITSVPAGIDSTSSTSCLFPPNTVVTLQARTTNGSNSFFSGWSGDGTGSFHDLTITLDTPKTVTANFQDQGWPLGDLIFVSSTVQASSLGVSGFDAVCNSLATAAGIPAQLSWEAYMRCGMGLCGSCERDGVLLCCEGPVVAAKPGGPDGAGGSE